jgi:DNA-binding transcriptional LysR family regulator
MLERTVDAVRSAAAGERGRLSLGFYGPSFYNNIVTRSALERFRADAPNVEIVSQELFSEQIVALLRDGRIDVGFSRGNPRLPDIDSRVIHVERLVVFLPESDPLASKPQVALADLDGRQTIAIPWELSRSLNERVAELMRNANATLKTVREAIQLSSIGYHVSLGEGVAILPLSSALFPVPGVAVRELSDPDATIDLVVLTRRGEQSPLVLRLLELLTAISAE